MNEVVSDLVKKSIDSISMIIAVKAGTPYSSNIQSCLPPSFNTSTSLIKIVHIINCPPSKVQYLRFIRNQVRKQFEPYQKLFGVAYCAVVTVLRRKSFYHQSNKGVYLRQGRSQTSVALYLSTLNSIICTCVVVLIDNSIGCGSFELNTNDVVCMSH
jgi:hypothetical protein